MAATYARSALFVDFDNLFLSLRDLSGQAVANSFATEPNKWLKWVTEKMGTAHLGENFSSRRILIRKCYLNPASFQNFRGYFTNAAFEVVDCPKLTSQGKTSTDIHMVMDILDTLNHPSRFDEIILFSADADFTPVLLRVRQNDRRSVIVAAGYSSPAYRAACDYLLPFNDFLQQALNVHLAEDEDEKLPAVAPLTSERVLDRLAEILSQRLETNGILNAYELPAIYMRLDDFRESKTWLGYMSLRSLTQAVVERGTRLRLVEDPEDGSWGVQLEGKAVLIEGPIPSVGADTGHAALAPSAGRSEQLEQVAEFIVEKVRESDKPVVMASLASQVKFRFGNFFDGKTWLGEGTFKSLLEKLNLHGLQLLSVTPGYVFDPARHSEWIGSLEKPADEHPMLVEGVLAFGVDRKNHLMTEFSERYPLIEPLAKQIHQLTDMPYLLPEHYALILNQIARAVNEKGFQLNQTTRLVRDRCVERGAPVARSHVNFIVIGINYAGYAIGQSGAAETPETLAQYLYQNALNLC